MTNAKHESTYICLWTVSETGLGKKTPLTKINFPANFQIARLSTGSAGKEVCDQFSVVKSRLTTISIASRNTRVGSLNF